jgi:formylglycine-generating enzyme required for sulfatase activity
MVLLIASENDAGSSAVADYLAAAGGHQIFTAGGMEELEEAAASLDELDVLLFSAAFSNGRGKELRDALRVQFPRLQTVLISDERGQCASPEQLAGWLAGLGNSSAAPVDIAGPVFLGDHELKEKRRTTGTTDSFRAVQRSVNREVILERLKPELQRDKNSVRGFRAMVRARANVSCPWMASVYEAQESDGALFYTRELIRGNNLDELAASRLYISPDECLQLLRAACEAVMWFAEKNLPREALKRHHVYHGSDGAPRIANIAAAAAATPLNEPAEIRAIAGGILRITDFKVGPARELSHILGLMTANGPHALTTWKSVLREVRAGLQRLTEARTSSLTEGRDMARPHRRKSRLPLIAGILALAGGGTAVAWYAKSPKRQVQPRRIGYQVWIPAGEFTFREGTRVHLPDFWIDSHEVTIGQYAEFLAATAGPAGNKFNHMDQPPDKTSHEPKDWSAILAAARQSGSWNSYPISVSCPVFNVDWWDAWAYAAWKGRRLPTEQEWEKAARGTNGRAWPWGSEPDVARANTGADYSDQPGDGKGATDGFRWWCEVDAMTGDISAWDVYGMAGNVSEWTVDWLPDPDLPDEKVPVFRGGDFRRKSPSPVTTPWLAKSAAYAQPFLGFRTVSSTLPR